MAKTKNVITEYRYYYLPVNFPVLLLSGDYWKISDVPSGRLHFHNHLEIGICHSESGFMEIFGEPVAFKAGDVTMIPQYVPHTTYSTPGTESHWSYIYIDPQELFRGLLPDTWKNSDFSVYSFQDYQPIFSKEKYPKIYYLAMAVIRELDERRFSYQLSVKGLLLSLYIEFYCLETEKKIGGGTGDSGAVNAPAPEAKTSLTIAPVLNYIEENYMQNFTVKDLADLCHWSPTHFRRVFHDIMGTSPLDFVNNTRISKACVLLRTTEESVLNISESVGFRSVSSFNRCFIKKMQMSPREYRKRIHKSDLHTESQSILEYPGWLYPEK